MDLSNIWNIIIQFNRKETLQTALNNYVSHEIKNEVFVYINTYIYNK